MNDASKFCGVCAARLTVNFLPLSFLIASWNSNGVFDVPRNSGSCGVSVSLAGKSLASVTAIGNVTVLDPPAAETVSVSVPTLAFFGTSSRNSSGTLALVAGIAAATGCPPPISVAVHPDGTPDTDKASRSGGKS